ncbi:DUF423 domain-containing protein [Chitinophaga niabensis]|uniref:Uncharacterized membrane protein YgdD, TMEM256/DUF423 family n=1 Tax=Chitinophaga niabensis TaxID=536979 RepID=A0A1N6FVM4_9BACT|nr:DUF423 domain-containing protein [Chitinophaga niabensis]SIN99270.1 Uncharacterized membrane protein YgdD, TMEM256/DUF423 family [Chitinophaga niabensis]
MHKTFLVWAALLGGLAVILGAFGAHKLKELVPMETVSTFQTGVTYQFYHVFALLAVGILYAHIPTPQLVWAGRFFLIGILLFSGSLYALTLLKATETVGLRGIGAITPLGGLFFIAGWVALLLGVLRK